MRIFSRLHGRQWIAGRLNRLETFIAITNHMTLQATPIVTEAWEDGLAKEAQALFPPLSISVLISKHLNLR